MSQIVSVIEDAAQHGTFVPWENDRIFGSGTLDTDLEKTLFSVLIRT